MACKCNLKPGDKVKWNGKSLFSQDKYTEYYEASITQTVARKSSAETFDGGECCFINFSGYKYNGWGCCDLRVVKKPKLKLPDWW